MLELTGNWKRDENAKCVLVEVKGIGYVPAPLAYDAPEQTVDNYLKGLTS